MNVRELKWFGLAMLIAATMIQAARADGDRPSQSVLNEMGLGGLVVMSDEDASSIRGQGFKGGHGSSVAVFGNSFATINTPFGSAHSENGYTAEGKHFAVGKNFSEAGVKIETNGGHHGRKPGHGGNHNNKWRGKPWPGKSGMAWKGKPSPKWGGKPGMGGNHGGGRPRVTSVKVFAGGFSFAAAK